MANKKFGKLLAFIAISGAAIATGIAYFKHKNNTDFYDDDLDDLDDDFDDEDFDFPLTTEDENGSVKREYVSINIDKDSEEKEASSTQTEDSVKQEDKKEEEKTEVENNSAL